MIKDTKESGFPPGEEGDTSSEIGKVVTTSTKATSSSTTCTINPTNNPTPWLRLKDPRIVRVSRVFGGKDRHSKVCTVRGLRDRRVRLSVPTAIQLYDLQDRLGLNQPSKVVDWLLDAAKNEIEELPPLPMLPGPNFSLLIPRGANNTSANPSQSSQGTPMEWDQLGNSSRLGWSNLWSTTTSTTNNNSSTKEDGKEDMRSGSTNNNNRSYNNVNGDDQGLGKEEGSDHDVIENNILQRSNNMINNHHHTFFPGMLNNNIANNLPSGYHPNYPLMVSHFGGSTDHNYNNLQSLINNGVASLQPSALSLSTGSQYLLCPQGSSSSSASSTTTTQTYYPNLLEIHDPRQASHFHQMPQNLLPSQMRSLFHFGSSDNGNSSTTQQSKERE